MSIVNLLKSTPLLSMVASVANFVSWTRRAEAHARRASADNRLHWISCAQLEPKMRHDLLS
jgi:hypothetical protein